MHDDTEADTPRLHLVPPQKRPRATTHARSDLLTAQLGEVGLAILALSGRADATEHMQKSGVPFSVALRMLHQPAKRRGAVDVHAVRLDVDETDDGETFVPDIQMDPAARPALQLVRPDKV